MKLPTRQLIAKAVFAVAVVATTATVGVVGFAQAARPAAAQNGYGGIDELMSSVSEFRQSMLTATADYRNDVDVCLGSAVPLNAHAQSNGAEDSKLKTAKDKFKQNLDQSVGALNTRVGDTRSAQEGSGSFERNFDDAKGQVFGQLNGAKDQLTADMGTGNQVAADQGGLFNCLDQARNKYQNTVDTAKAKLLDAIRRILG
jgi:hypothetical protein